MLSNEIFSSVIARYLRVLFLTHFVVILIKFSDLYDERYICARGGGTARLKNIAHELREFN